MHLPVQPTMKSLPALVFACVCLFSPFSAIADVAPEVLLAARDAAKAGDQDALERLAPGFQGDELSVYLDYWRFQPGLKDVDPAQIRDFLQRNNGSYIADKLRGDWLRAMGKEARWEVFDADYPGLQQTDQEITCYALQRRLARGEVGALDEAMPLWLKLVDTPDACYPVLEALIINKRVQIDDVWARIRRQFETNRLSGARYTMNYLPESQTPDAKTMQAFNKSPVKWLIKLPASTLSEPRYQELAALAVGRIARTDPAAAATQMERIEAKLPAEARSWAWGQIGWKAAQQHLPEAVLWFRQAGQAALSDEVSQWKVRAALRAQDWESVRTAIEALPPELAAQPTWIYWLGRAYTATGKAETAQGLYAMISGQPNFYGNLADEALGRRIDVPPKATPVTTEEIDRVAGISGLRRGLALLRAGLRLEGVREFNWGLRGLDDRGLLAAAELARRAQVFDRAIAAADRTKGEHDYALRYLAPFLEQVRPAAQGQMLDDAWVYGLMRQESRFVTDARSSAGASGLMQLMPATARWVAKKIGLTDYSPDMVTDTDTNLLLGTSYMRMVLEDLDNHPVLASAAYNAGPRRARRWRAAAPLEGAIYAETIPFSETRDYVKKVMSNTAYYALLFGQSAQTLTQRLGTVGPRTDPVNPDLP